MVVFEETMESSNKGVSTLETHAASKDAEAVTKVVRADNLDGCIKLDREGARLLSATICKYDSQCPTLKKLVSVLKMLSG